jgi:predicted transcriptional regulator
MDSAFGEREAKWARFEAEIQKGIDSADRGELIPVDEAFAELDRYIEDIIARKNRTEAA